LLTKDGIATYKMAERVKVRNSAGTATSVKMSDTYNHADAAWSGTEWSKSSSILGEMATVPNAPTALRVRDVIYKWFHKSIDASTTTGTGSSATTTYDFAYTPALPAVAAYLTVDPNTAKMRTIKFGLNGNNEINEIIPMATAAADYQYDLSAVSSIEKDYDADATQLGNKALDEKAIVISIDIKNAENSKFADASYFVDESSYSALMLDPDKYNDFYAAAVVLGTEASFAQEDPIAIVKDVKNILADDGDSVVQVKVVKAGVEETLIFDDDELTTGTESSTWDVDDFEVGTVIMYTANGSGLVSKYDVIGKVLYGNEGNGNGLVANATTPYHNGHKVFRFDTRYKGTTANFNKTYGDSFYYGYITAKTSRSVTLNILDYASDVTITSSNYDEFGKYTISADANQYTITGTKKATAKVEIGAYDFGNIDKRGTGVDGTANNTDDEVYTVLVRTYEDKVVDIIGLDTTVIATVVSRPIMSTTLS